LINFFQSIPLIYKLIPTRLSAKEKEFYQTHFISFFKKSQFKTFIEYAKYEKFITPGPLAIENNSLSDFYFFTRIPHGSKVEIFHKGKTIGEVFDGQWCGIVDAWIQF